MNALDGELRDGRHVMSIRVYYEDTDFSGIVYHANYLRFMERGRSNHLRLLGTHHRALFEEASAEAPGFAFVVRSMQIEFLKPARMDDVLAVVTARRKSRALRSRSISAFCEARSFSWRRMCGSPSFVTGARGPSPRRCAPPCGPIRTASAADPPVAQSSPRQRP
jgi:tol-pal system-associated acyl-CoA thioesterase